ncbi:MAG: hypothetical protein J6S43_02650 [Lentisphaeria bacterium]|nr:hypothetical protein [Lentisphaeria bacterium]
MKKFLLFMSAWLLFPVQADDALVKKILALPENTGGEIVYFNDFSDKSKLPNFRYTSQFSLDPSGGENGSAAIKCEKTDPAQLQDLSVRVPVLPGGKTYITETVIRAEDIKFSGTGIASSSIELRKDKKRVAGGVYSVYRKKDYTPGKWFVLKAEFSISGENIAPRYSIYMMRNTTGRFYISSLCIKTAGHNASILLRRPYNMTLDPAGTPVEFKVSGAPANARMLLTINSSSGEQHLFAAGENDIFRTVLPPLPPGKATITVRVTDANAGELYCQSKYDFTVRKLEVPEYGVMPDEFQRITVNGKPFMPIGIYGYQNSKDKDLQNISEAGFNCFLDYDSPSWGRRSGDIAGFRAMLDKYQKYGLKCIFNIRWQSPYTGNSLSKTAYAGNTDAVTAHIVRALADHPALLAWYVSDETTRVNIPQIVHLRQIVSAADPYHPTVGTSCYPTDLPLYGNAADIIAVDPYPIGDTGSIRNIPQSLAGMFNLMNGVKNNGQILWIVPQAFSWGGYRTNSAEKFNLWRHPTAEEIRTMPLLAALHGARGFIFYTYRPRGYQFSAEYENLRWQAIRESVKELKALEKFIMGSKKPEIIEQQPDYRCGILTADDGKRAVILTGIKEKAAGKITLPEGRWEKLSGQAEISSNQLIFDFNAINSAVFVEK